VVFNASNCSSGGMYLRDLVHGTTVLLPGTGYAGRTADGTKIFVASDQSNGDLAEYEISTGRLTDIAAGQLLASSDDGSRVYYLGPGNALYLWNQGTTKMIPGTDAGGYDPGAVATAALQPNVPDTTPDGASFLFIDSARLTGYDNQGHREAYLYRAASNSVICLSCNPSGASPDSNSNPSQGQNDAHLLDLGRVEADPLLPTTMRFVSSDGRRAVFETTDTLLPVDHNPPQANYNGVGGAPGMDVYEWEADGTGSCQASGVTGGCLYLLSAGRAGLSSYLAGASADLTDVYIMTADQLLPGLDGALHVYDARIDGGFAAPSVPAACAGDACPGAVVGAPALPVAASVTFAGPGNPTRAAARAGRVTVMRETVKGARFVLTVNVPGGGTIVVSGGGVRTVRKTVTRAGAYKVTVSLTRPAGRALTRRRRLTVTVGVHYTPATGPVSTATVTTTMIAPRRSRR
jgi:hypothetical protein